MTGLQSPGDDRASDKSGENDWGQIISQLGLSGLAAQLAGHCVLQSYADGEMHLLLDETGSGLVSASSQAALQEALDSWAGQPVKLTMDVSAVQTETPAMRYARLQEETRQQIEQTIRQDPFVQQLQSELGGEIVPGSIRAKDKGK